MSKKSERTSAAGRKPEDIERLAAPDALGIPGRTVSSPLSQALYAIGREQSDEEIESADLGMWAGLIRDTETVADHVPEASLAGDAGVKPDEIDPAELPTLRASAGVIVTRDIDGNISARVFASHDELAAAWSAVLVELEDAGPGTPTARSPGPEDIPT